MTPADVTDTDKRWLADQTTRILAAAAAKESSSVQSMVQEIATRYQAVGIWALLHGLAGAVAQLGMGVNPVTGRHAGLAELQITTDSGRPVEPEDLPPDLRPKLWAARFVTAFVNDDRATLNALFDASLRATTAEHLADMAALIGLAGRAVAQAADGGEPS